MERFDYPICIDEKNSAIKNIHEDDNPVILKYCLRG
jgi:hypothetical protein